MAENAGPPRAPLSRTGWRAPWRGVRTTMAFAFRADPAMFAWMFALGVVSGALGGLATASAG